MPLTIDPADQHGVNQRTLGVNTVGPACRLVGPTFQEQAGEASRLKTRGPADGTNRSIVSYARLGFQASRLG